MRTRYLGAVIAALGLAAASAVPAGAGPGDVVLNPGPAGLTIEGGTFTIAGSPISLPEAADPPQCSDGINNDFALDAPGDPLFAQDELIDDGADPECDGPLDNSEIIPGFQPKEDISLEGDVDADGLVEFDTSYFPPLYIWMSGGFPLLIQFDADVSTSPDGTVDPGTGAIDADLALGLTIAIPDGGGGFLPACSTGSFGIVTSTVLANAANSGPLVVNPVLYDTADGGAVLSSNTFSVPAAAALFPDPGIEFFCGEVNTAFGLPSDYPDNAADLGLTLLNTDTATPFQSGVAPSVGDLGGVVLGLGDDPVPGLIVSLYSANAHGRLATAVTGVDGSYEFTGLTPGDYRVRVLDPTNLYPTRWWSDAANYFVADDVPVVGDSLSTADFDLRPAGSISGTITNDLNGLPVPGASVRLYTPSGLVAIATADAEGDYAFMNMAPRTDYAIQVVATGFAREWYLDAPTYFSPQQQDIVLPQGGSADADLAIMPL